uniref:ORF2 n=1 Tax=Geobacillus stearothermophilus TaxID=1422 RepID=Q45627_GEOSE|nr:ORF2 [Geobacillus stearothermophilus]BAA06247.1 hypothetical protein [Geobacillus stearothermophilus]BAA06269.1 unnamed protein product [Geobacillus stearothermophilus]prf//2102242B ORF 2 in cryptic plasmid pSTK1 [Geobacillus stearothermophilus]
MPRKLLARVRRVLGWTSRKALPCICVQAFSRQRLPAPADKHASRWGPVPKGNWNNAERPVIGGIKIGKNSESTPVV